MLYEAISVIVGPFFNDQTLKCMCKHGFAGRNTQQTEEDRLDKLITKVVKRCSIITGQKMLEDIYFGLGPSAETRMPKSFIKIAI